jgi:hypothetical protein
MGQLFLLAVDRSDVHEISLSPHHCSEAVFQACQNETSCKYKYLVFMPFVQSDFLPHIKAAQGLTDHLSFHKRQMARNIQNPSNTKQSSHIGAQFEHFTQIRTNSRLREMSQDLKDAIKCNKTAEAQSKAAAGASEPGPHLTQVHRAWTSARGPSMADRTIGPAGSRNAVQGWLAEPERAQAWNDDGAVPQRHGSPNDNKTRHSYAGGKAWSNRSVAGS